MSCSWRNARASPRHTDKRKHGDTRKSQQHRGAGSETSKQELLQPAGSETQASSHSPA